MFRPNKPFVHAAAVSWSSHKKQEKDYSKKSDVLLKLKKANQEKGTEPKLSEKWFTNMCQCKGTTLPVDSVASLSLCLLTTLKLGLHVLLLLWQVLKLHIQGRAHWGHGLLQVSPLRWDQRTPRDPFSEEDLRAGEVGGSCVNCRSNRSVSITASLWIKIISLWLEKQWLG